MKRHLGEASRKIKDVENDYKLQIDAQHFQFSKKVLFSELLNS